MKLKRCILALVAVLSSFALTTYALVAMESESYVAKIGDVTYDTFDDALAAANAMSGEVTMEIYDKVTLTTSLSGNYSSIKFVGMDDTDAEIYLDVQGYITATGKTVAFENLTLSKSAGGYITNAGFMNVAFGVYDVTAVTYTDCVFANGAYASSGTITYTGCTFQRSHDKYGLWAYGDAVVTVDDCTFDNARGIKMYSEDPAKTAAITVKNTDFTALTEKPAIVLTYGESVVLENNDYSPTGTLGLDSGGAPNGVPVTSDVAPVCVNGNDACGVLVDGKIYTTVAHAAEVATEDSNVTLLYSTTETVEFAEGVNLTLATGVTADNVTVATSYVAKVGEVGYTDLQEAIKAAAPAGTVELLSDVVVDKWIMFSETLSIGNGNIITTEINGLTINGNGKTVTIKDIESAGNGNRLFSDATLLNINNITFNFVDDAANEGGIGLTAGTIENVTFNGGGYAILPGTGDVTIQGCTFRSHSTSIYYETDRDNLLVTGNIFENDETANVILLRGNTTFTNNMVLRGRTVNVVSGSPVVTGNDFNDVRLKVYNEASATIEGNIINTLAFSDATSIVYSTFNNNTLGTEAQTVFASANFPVPVAKIGEVVYTDLQAAITAAQPGVSTTITVLSNITLTEGITIPADKTIVLDLAGDTISQVKEQTAAYQMILNEGNLTIVDSSVAQTGTISYTDSGNGGEYISDAIYNKGVLVIDGGTIENLSSATVATNGYPHAVDTYSGIRNTSVTINGGTIKCANYSAIRMYCTSATYTADLLITGGTVIGAIDMQNGTKIAARGSLTINDGNFQKNASKANIRFANWNGGATEYGITGKITGGTFDAGINTNYVPADANFDKGIISGGTFGVDVTEYCCAKEGYAALQNSKGLYVIGVAPSATVTNLGERVVAAGDYSVYPNGDTTEDLNLPFVMQFTANHTKEQAASTPFGKWYGDFVVSFDGFENGGFTADGCYLAGNYGSFGWVKVPVDDMEIKNGERFPIMLSITNGAQTYEGICDYVKDFLCALYLTPEIVNANPNLKVTLELDVVENSDDAYEALQNGTNIYQVASYDYTASDFAAPVAKIGEVEYKTLQAAIDAAQAGETITVLRDITLTEGVTVADDDEITLNLNGMTISQEKECTASYQMIQNNGSLTITGDGKISFKDTSAGDSSFGWGSYTINNRGTLVVENGTIEHLGEQVFATHMICAIQQGAGSTTINGGLISTPNYRSVRINAGSLTINGGEFDGQVWLQPNQGDATLAVTGGTFAPNGRDASSIFMTNTGENNTVSGASISGGTFTTKIGCSDASKLAGTISGGSFSEAAVSGTNTDLLVVGYEFETEADANGYYGIEWTGNVDELVIVDGELTEFVNEQEMTIGKLTYKRTLSSESYNALYVPFAIPVDSLSDNYDVFYIYDVRSYDNDEDGTPDDWDMEVFKLNKGTLKANYPYFIRPKSPEALDMVLTLEDATLCKSDENSVVCSSVFMIYEVKGLYHQVENGELYGHYGISSKGRWIPIGNAVLSPFRFYLKMTDKDGSSVNVSEEALSSMRIRVIGEGNTTDIEHLKQESNRSTEIYDLQGRRVQTPSKGFYIVNGKKVYIK